MKELKSIVSSLRDDGEMLRFRKLDLKSLKIVCFCDAGFASHSDDLKSQLGFVIALVDAAGCANVVSYASRKCRRVTRSVLASELLALVEGYDTAAAIAVQLREILGRAIAVQCVTDSRTLFNIVTRLGTITEQRLKIDAADLRAEHLADRLLLLWLPSEENCADPLTKKRGQMSALDELLNGRCTLRPNAWIERVEHHGNSGGGPTLPLMP